MPWDNLQEIHLNDLRQRQTTGEIDTRNLDADLGELKRQLRKMALVSQALFELLKERTGITDEQLRAMIHEVDLRDGHEGGRLDAPPLTCPECGGTVTAGALKCQSCGAPLAPEYPFEK